MRQILNIPIPFYILISSSLAANCTENYPWQRITVKHKEFNGIGYDSGYTSLDLFLAASPYERQFYFLDVRGHALNTGGFALNAGIGTRYLLPTSIPTILGINTYYDYRTNKGLSFNQVGIGLEALGTQWEARLNGYIPIGGWNQYQGFQGANGYSAIHFYQHYLVIGKVGDQIYTSPLGEIDSEFGYHFQPTKHRDLDLYLGAGPYYLQWSDNRVAIGGAARLALSMSQYVNFTATYSYDRFFHNIGQGEIGFTLPFGTHESFKEIDSTDCDLAYFLNKRISQDVYRQEILPIKSVYDPTATGLQYAINPLTNLPYYFVFVNNTIDVDGTYEGPYKTFLEAQNNSKPYDIIYAYPGDGTVTGMNTGLILQQNQWLFGASIPHTIPVLNIGPVTIPPMAATAPIVTNVNSGVAAVTLGNENIVSGLTVLALQGNGITGTNISNPQFDQNTFIGTPALNVNGINLIDPINTVNVTSSSFSNFYQTQSADGGTGIYIRLDSTTASIALSQNSFNNIHSNISGYFGGVGAVAIANGGNIPSFVVTDCTFSNIGVNDVGGGTVGIGAALSAGTFDSLIVSNCTFSNFGNVGLNTAEGIAFISGAGVIRNIDITSCTFSNFTGNSDGIGVYRMGGAIDSFAVSSSTFDNFSNQSSGVRSDNDNSSGGDLNSYVVTNCVFTNISDNSYGILSSIVLDTLRNFIVTNNYFANLSGSSSGISHSNNGGILHFMETESNIFYNLQDSSAVSYLALTNSTCDLLSISSNVMQNIQGASNAISYTSGSSNFTSLDISNNSWSGISNSIAGWGITATISAGTTCSAIENNTASPAASSPHSISINRTGGTFNVESNNGSASGVQSLNNGAAVDTSGTIAYVSPGTCP